MYNKIGGGYYVNERYCCFCPLCTRCYFRRLYNCFVGKKTLFISNARCVLLFWRIIGILLLLLRKLPVTFPTYFVLHSCNWFCYFIFTIQRQIKDVVIQKNWMDFFTLVLGFRSKVLFQLIFLTCILILRKIAKTTSILS